MNVSICETNTNCPESEPTEKWEKDRKPDDDWTNDAVSSTTKKMKIDHIKMSCHKIIASSDLFLLDSYQDCPDLESNLTMTRAIIGIPRKNASWWIIS